MCSKKRQIRVAKGVTAEERGNGGREGGSEEECKQGIVQGRRDGSSKEKKKKREHWKRPCIVASYMNTRFSILRALAFCRYFDKFRGSACWLSHLPLK